MLHICLLYSEEISNRTHHNILTEVYWFLIAATTNYQKLSQIKGFPGASVVKISPANAGDMGFIHGSGRSPGEGNGYPLPEFLLGESYGQRSLQGYSPRSHKELDVT